MLQRQAAERQQQFEAEWGPSGSKRQTLLANLQRVMTRGQQNFEAALKSGGVIERGFQDQIQALESMNEAREFGATHTINATGDDLIQAVKDQTSGRGADYTFEAAGIDHTLQPSLDVTRPGGDVILLGKTLASKELPIRWASLAPERMITRSSYGGVRPKEDLPFLARSYLRGDLKLDELIDTRIQLDQINKGFSDMEEGWLVRSVIEFNH